MKNNAMARTTAAWDGPALTASRKIGNHRHEHAKNQINETGFAQSRDFAD
jgi:hypothetical protein